MHTKKILSIPSTASTMWRAFTSFSKGKDVGIPEQTIVMENVTADPKKLAAFKKLTGYTSVEVPSTYWHTRFFGVRILLAANPKSPFALPGMVHLTDTIRQYHSILSTDKLRMECSLGRFLAHEKGTAFETITKLYRDNTLVWEEITVNLHIGNTKFAQQPYDSYEFSDIPNATQTPLHIAPYMGRKYAAVSGDYNPIHIHPLGAKLFGFKRSLMHGWYGLNRILSNNESLLSEPHELFVAFKKPLFMPGDVFLRQTDIEKGVQFEVTNQKEGYPNLKGYLKKL